MQSKIDSFIQNAPIVIFIIFIVACVIIVAIGYIIHKFGDSTTNIFEQIKDFLKRY